MSEPVIWHLYRTPSMFESHTRCGKPQPSEVKFPDIDYIECTDCLKEEKKARLREARFLGEQRKQLLQLIQGS